MIGSFLTLLSTAVPTYAVQSEASADRALLQLLDRFLNETLQLTPFQASWLGFASGPHQALKSKLDDISAEGDAHWLRLVKSMLSRIRAIDASQLSPALRLRYDSVVHFLQAALGGASFPNASASLGYTGGARPYVIDQMEGTTVDIPELLASKHTIKTSEDAEAYLSRLHAMARMIRQENARIPQQAALGIVPPTVICEKVLHQLTLFATPSPEQNSLVTTLVNACKQAHIAGDWEKAAAAIVKREIYPAVATQIELFRAAAAKADDVPGVHKLPHGDDYYAWALNQGTTTTDSPATIHATGVEQRAEIVARIDAIMQRLGKTDGTVGQRLKALGRDPANLFPDTDAGRSDLIAYCNDKVSALRDMLPRISHLEMRAPLRIERFPPEMQEGAPLARMVPAAIDGSTPAVYYINLTSTSTWPKFSLPTTTAHEGIPGHTWQFAYLAEHGAKIPDFAKFMMFNAYIEGWALYAETLCQEQGFYRDDPLGEIGYLQAQLFRTCRLVVDTGIHAMKWTRQQAVDFMLENLGSTELEATREIDRYTVLPGQACGYKAGMNEMMRQRQRAQSALGDKFDQRGFNDTLVACGGVPLTVMTSVVDQFIAQEQGKSAST